MGRPSQDLAALARDLESDAAMDAAELARRLLLLGRANPAPLARALADEEVLVAVWPFARRAGDSLFGSRFDLSLPVRHSLATALRGARRAAPRGKAELASALVARRIALELDASPLGELLVDRLLAAGSRVLAPDDLVPLLSPFAAGRGLREAYAGRLGTSPQRLGLSPDALPRSARLVPALPYALSLRLVTGWHELDALGGGDLVACAIPSAARDLTEPLFEGHTGSVRFFGVGPRDPAGQTARALALAAEADRAGARLLVLPEVSLDEAGADALAAWVEEDAERVRVAVCGTFHAERDGRRQNIALVVAPRVRVEVRKIVPFVTQAPSGGDAEEDVRGARPELVLLAGTTATAMVLVCRDFIDREIARAVEDLRPSFVLSPACSPRTSDFAAGAAKLASGAQAHVVVANLCDASDAEDPCVALLARPDRRDPAPAAVLRRAVEPPVLLAAPLGPGAGWRALSANLRA